MRKLYLTIIQILVLLNIVRGQSFTYSPTFDANLMSPGFNTSDGTPWNNTNLYPISMADVNGDGYPDIVGFGITGVFVSLNSGFSFSTPALWSTSFGINSGWTSFDAFPRYARDINGDGLADLIGFGNTAVTVVLSNSTHFVTSATWTTSYTNSAGWTSFDTKMRVLADVNGDGKPDIVGFNNNAVYVSINSGTSFGTATIWLSQFVSNFNWATFTAKPRFLADINGDGKFDIVGMNGTLWVAYSTGSAFTNFSALSSSFYAANNWNNQSFYPLNLADVNGDNVADFIEYSASGISVEIVANKRLGAPVQYASLSVAANNFLVPGASNIIFTDIDNNKKVDIIAFSNSNNKGIKVFLNGVTGSSSAKAQTCTLCAPNNSSCNPCNNLPVFYINGMSSCAPGLQTTSTNRLCTSMASSVTISIDFTDKLLCQSLIVNAGIRSSDMSYYSNINYIWSGYSNSSTPSQFAAFKSYMFNQVGSKITIPYSLIEPRVTYTFTVSYLDALKTNLSNTVSLGPFTHLFPSFFTPSTIISNFMRGYDTHFAVDFVQGLCITPFTGIVTTWNQTTGPRNNTKFILDDFSIIIPSCSFNQNTSYTFNLNASLPQAPQFATQKTYRFDIPFDSFYTIIPNSNRTHPYTLPIPLQAQTFFFGSCPEMNTSIFTYRWLCTIDMFGDGYFSNCDDSEGLFNKIVNRSSFNLSTSYFSYAGATLQIVVTAIKQGRRSVATAFFYITGPSTLPISISCDSGPTCYYYNSNQEIYLRTRVMTLSYYTPKWLYNPITTSLAYNNQLYFNFDTLKVSSGPYRLSSSVSMGTTYGYSNFSIFLNSAPRGGFITVTPSTGVSLTTEFAIQAINFTDIDLPLTYQYFLTDGSDEWPLSFVLYQSSFSTDLPGFASSYSEQVIVKVMDSYGATNKSTTGVTVTVSGTALSDQVTFLDSFVQSIPETQIESMQEYLFASLQLKGLVEPILQARTYLQSCTGCAASKQTCLFGICTCKAPGLTAQDCSVTSTIYTQITTLNSRICTQIQSLYYNFLNMPQYQFPKFVVYWNDMVIESLKAISRTLDLSNEANQIRIHRILENNIDVYNLQKPLTKSQLGDLAEILDNTITFLSKTDCECSSAFCLDFPKKIASFAEKFKKVTLNNTIPGQGSRIMDQNNFEIMTTRISACDIQLITFSMTSNSPQIKLTAINSSVDCSQILDFVYITLKNRSQVFNCTGQSPSEIKDSVILGIFDSTTQSGLLDAYLPQLLMPSGISCPAGCITEIDRSCTCLPQMFNMTVKLLQIFNGSVFNFVNPVGPYKWKWDDNITWVSAGFLGWFIVTIVLVSFVSSLKNYCILGKVENSGSVVLATMMKIFTISEDILSLYLLNKHSTPKIFRTGLYYLRILTYSILATAFSNSVLTSDFVDIGLNFPLEYYFVPYACKAVFIGIFHNVIKFFLKRSKSNIKKEKAANWIVGLTLLFLILGMFYLFYMTLQDKKSDFQTYWLTLFTIFFIQDITIIPVLYMLYQLILVSMVSKMIRQSKTFKIFYIFSDKQIFELYVTIFGRSQVHPGGPNSLENLPTDARNNLNPKFNTEDTTKPIQRDTGSMNTILNVNESMGNIQLQKRDLNEIPVFDLEKEPDSPEIQVKKLTRKKSTIAEIRRQKTLFKMGSEDLGSTQAILESQAKIENEDT